SLTEASLGLWRVNVTSASRINATTPNGVAERFNRTMKEQVIHGRLFNNVGEVRAAAVAFKDRYNREWRLEKLVFKIPLEARQAPLLPLAA
ncbi:MAG: integrase core domain-containing protein, partial [Burkholderia sp.]